MINSRLDQEIDKIFEYNTIETKTIHLMKINILPIIENRMENWMKLIGNYYGNLTINFCLKKKLIDVTGYKTDILPFQKDLQLLLNRDAGDIMNNNNN